MNRSKRGEYPEPYKLAMALGVNHIELVRAAEDDWHGAGAAPGRGGQVDAMKPLPYARRARRVCAGAPFTAGYHLDSSGLEILASVRDDAQPLLGPNAGKI